MNTEIAKRILETAPAASCAKPPPEAITTPITRILVPVDLSPRSLEASDYAKSLAAAFGARLVFVHAIQTAWPPGPAARRIHAEIRANHRTHRFVFREGSPAAVILQTAETEQCDLILMPTRGMPPLARLLDGSITAQILRAAKCPVWVGLDNMTPLPARPIRNVLCGLSLGPRADAVLRWAANMAARFNAGLSLVHANKGLEANPGLPLDPEWRFWMKRFAREDIRALQNGAGTHADVWLEPGSPLHAIPPLADRLRADLVVIGKSPEKRFLNDVRTLSYEIAYRTPCPVASA
jgi:nucleotide-binding universal stress UspA family protein